jgi:hypothetical protein
MGSTATASPEQPSPTPWEPRTSPQSRWSGTTRARSTRPGQPSQAPRLHARDSNGHSSVLDGARASRTSMPHEALARLIHEGSVELVISFNWDSALERAYERLYGPSLPRSTLLKPPGDVAHPNEAWVLPHEDGVVTAEMLTPRRHVAGFADLTEEESAAVGRCISRLSRALSTPGCATCLPCRRGPWRASPPHPPDSAMARHPGRRFLLAR